MNVPVIRLELHGIKQTLLVALADHNAQIDADVRAAIDRFCEPTTLRETVMSAATSAIKRAVQEEVESFFKYGNGRAAIKAAVQQAMPSTLQEEE
jgi:hypothetical protein